MGRRAAMTMERQHVRLRGKLFDRRDIARPDRFLDPWRGAAAAVVEDPHAERADRESRHRLANAAKAYQPERLAGEAAAAHVCRPPTGPSAVPQLPLTFAGATTDHQHEQRSEEHTSELQSIMR